MVRLAQLRGSIASTGSLARPHDRLPNFKVSCFTTSLIMLETFIIRQTRPQRAALVPELVLRLAAEPRAIFDAVVGELPEDQRLPPLWAFAWPGGQALARHLLDHPELVRDRRIVDIGAGSGIAAIAASRAGARHVLAADIDPVAAEAVQLNAATNGVTLDISTADLLGNAPAADLFLQADLVYDPDLATRVAAFLDGARQSGAHVLIADRVQSRRPPGALEQVAEYAAPLTPAIPELPFDKARLWRLADPLAARRAQRKLSPS